MRYFATALLGFSLFFQSGFASAQVKASMVFLLEDAGNNQWCSYLTESTWKAKVQRVGAMTVGTLAYSNDRLSQIDVTGTDESGDWTVYDHYFFDDHGQLVKLTRLLNVLPGDRSVSQTFLISNGKATKTATSEKHLSTGKPVATSTADWLPDVALETDKKMFPFSALLSRPELRTSRKSCVKVPAAQ
jgi:hypothetical protein